MRQFGQDQKVMIIRNGWFSYRWSQIFESTSLSSELKVIKAQRVLDEHQAAFKPPALEEVIKEIQLFKPKVVFAPHVETSAGIIMDQAYISAIAKAAHAVGALMVLDCIASGCIWVDMQQTGVDVLISAPQKGWSSSPSAGLVMLSERAEQQLENTSSNSSALDLKKWRSIQRLMKMVHMPIMRPCLPMHCVFSRSFERSPRLWLCSTQEAQWALGQEIRAQLKTKGIKSVAAPGYEAPSVVVVTDDVNIHNGTKFAAQGIQIAASPLSL